LVKFAQMLHAQSNISMSSEPTYFANADALRQWFKKHASNAMELHVGFMKISSGKSSVTWPESVDEALCVGWIDGVRHRVDAERYRIRLTPRRPGSHWSAINIARMAVLQAEGRVQPAGLAAFARRTEAKSRKAAYEQPSTPEFDTTDAKAFKRHRAAWKYYEALPGGYKKTITWWVVSAKQLATRKRRLSLLIAACAEGRRI
jgi:uncharacterized protein YdeI (YjbR/CyaY-like superfamily)